MPGYPWWARAVTLPVSCYRVSPSGGPCPIRLGSASGLETQSKKYQRASLVGPRAVRSAPGARRLPTVVSHSENSLLVSDTT